MDVTKTFEFDEFSYLCDGWLQGDDGKLLPVHRILMAAISPYFRTAFVTESNGKASNLCRVKGFQSNSLEEIIRFAVIGKVTFADDNIRDIIYLADFLEINKLLSLCNDYIISNLSTRNCVYLYQSLLPLEHLGFTKTCLRFIETHFEQLVRKEISWLSALNVGTLEELLLSDSLNITEERTVVAFVYLWVKNYSERIEECRRLISCIRMNKLELSVVLEELDPGSIENHLLIQNNARSKRRLKRPIVAYNYLIFQNTASSCTCWITYEGKLDIYRNHLVIPFAPSVISGDSLGNVYLLDDSQCWSLHPGQNGLRQIRYPSFHRCNYGTAVCDGCLYIIGGALADQPLVKIRTVERFDPVTGQWSWIQITQFSCSGPVAVLKGKIYVLSSQSFSNSFRDFISAERYDPNSNSWTQIAPILRLTSFYSVLAFRSRLFVLGRNNEKILLMSYNPDANHWRTFSEISEELQHPKITVVGDSLILYDESPNVTDTRMWERSSNQWVETFNPLLQRFCHSKILRCDSVPLSLRNRTAFQWKDVRSLIIPTT